MKFLAKKKVLVTGGSRGLGRAFCLEFASQGADIAFTYSSDETAAAETAQSISELGVQVKYYKVSVLEIEAIKAMKKDLDSSWGTIDILVNNAGVSQALPLALMEEGDWDLVLDTNVKGLYNMSHTFLPAMIKQKKGIILNIGSLAGVRILAAPIHYCTSKAGVKGFTESLSKEVSRYNIRVNCLAPGLLEEGVARNIPDYKLNDFLKNVSLHRRGTLEEVAKFAGFLVSDKNTYMTGATIVMDGGL